MKKIFTTLLLAIMALPAFCAESPAPILVTPRNGETGLFYGGIGIVWDFNTIKQNPEAENLDCTLIWPDGHEQIISGRISDANGSETQPPFPQAEGKPYVNNELLFIQVNLDKAKFEYIFMKGKYDIIIPEGIVLIDVNSVGEGMTPTEPEWVPNAATTLSFYASDGEDPEGGSGDSGVDTVSVNEEGVYFDLQGRRVVNPDRGIYIVNGKKVIL